jgi:hypothetical protein
LRRLALANALDGDAVVADEDRACALIAEWYLAIGWQAAWSTRRSSSC